MRVTIDGAGEPLRRALGDLVRAAGHEVTAGAADLRIRVGESPPPRSSSAATLWLCPVAVRPADPDPSAALDRVLASGGTAVWADSFDPDVLFDRLRGGTPRVARPRVGPGGIAFDAAPDPWFGLDPRTRGVRWANAAARAALPLSNGDSAAPAAEWNDLVDRPEGRARIRAGGREWSATWWTDETGARVVGLSAPSGDAPSAHVRSLAELGQMAATLAHEIRNPVAAFAGALDLLAQDLAPHDRDELVALARGRVEQMRVLLDDTLRLARPLKGPPTPVECALVVRSAVGGVATDPLFAGVRVTTSIEDDAICVLGYEQPLRQAVANLLVNAAQAQGGKGAVDVSLRRDGAFARLAVADEGPGIPADLRERVFEPFWTTKSSGTGLGLAYVRRVAEACAGSVRAEDAPRGALMVLRLPLARGRDAE